MIYANQFVVFITGQPFWDWENSSYNNNFFLCYTACIEHIKSSFFLRKDIFLHTEIVELTKDLNFVYQLIKKCH